MNNDLTSINYKKPIEDKIINIRGTQVMLDSDVAYFFNIETKVLNQQMKRNQERFPEDFCFQLNHKEFKSVLRSQNVTSNGVSSKRRYMPYVYTEYGIIALAGVLKSDVATKMSVEIARTFLSMRKFILENGDVLVKLAQLQNRQINFEIEANKRFDEVIGLINKANLPKQVLFFAGQYYDAYDFISMLIRKANKPIVLIDSYCDNRALSFISNKQNGVEVNIYKSSKAKLLDEEIQTFEKQYGDINVKTVDSFHDRFLIIDERECYSLGASLNYIGRKTFAVSLIEDQTIIESILKRIADDLCE